MVVQQPPDALGHGPLRRQQPLLRAVGDQPPGSRERAAAALEACGPVDLGDEVVDRPEQQPEDHRRVARAEVDVALDDRVAELAQELHRAVERAADLGREAALHARGERGGDRDPQRAGIRPRRVGERPRGLGER